MSASRLNDLIATLMDDSLTRLKIYVNLETNHLHNCMRRYYHQSVVASCARHKLDAGQLLGSRSAHWDWCGMPEKLTSVVIYTYVSSIVMTYSLVRNCTIEIADNVAASWLKLAKPAHCYLLGRFLMTDNMFINRTVGILTAMANLFWPIFQTNRTQRMSCPFFLMLTTRDLNNYHALISRDSEGLRGDLASLSNCSTDTKLGARPSGGAPAGRQQLQQQQRERPYPESHGDELEWARELVVVEFLHDIMSHCIVMPNGRQMIQLRPNRTLQANRRLRRLMALMTAYFDMLLAATACIIAYMLIEEGLSCRTIERDYPGCQPELQSLLMNAYSSPDYLLRFFNRQLFTPLTFELIENLILWVELGGIAYGIDFSVLVNYDLIIYWQYLHNRISTILQTLARNSPTGGPLQESQQADLFYRNLLANRCGPLGERPQALRQSVEMDDQILVLTAQIHDFIREVEKVNMFMSDILTIALLIWVGIFTSYVYITPIASELTRTECSSKYCSQADDTTWNHVLILGVPLFSIAATLISLLIPHRYCNRTYPALCSLMAHYHSPNKRNLIPILSFFHEKRTSYKLFRMNPFLPTTFLSLIGWSFSCFFIIRGMVLHRR